jgi:hypothetical protein
VYLASQPDHHREHAGGTGTMPPEPDGPLPGHPERLCPEVPLTAQERLLMRDLGHLAWALPEDGR